MYLFVEAGEVESPSSEPESDILTTVRRLNISEPPMRIELISLRYECRIITVIRQRLMEQAAGIEPTSHPYQGCILDQLNYACITLRSERRRR